MWDDKGRRVSRGDLIRFQARVQGYMKGAGRFDLKFKWPTQFSFGPPRTGSKNNRTGKDGDGDEDGDEEDGDDGSDPVVVDLCGTDSESDSCEVIDLDDVDTDEDDSDAYSVVSDYSLD